MEKLPTDAPDFLKSLLGGALGGQRGLTTTLLGSGTNAIGTSLSQRLGFDVRPLLNLAVPVVGGIIGKFVRDQKLSATALSSQLQKDPATTSMILRTSRPPKTVNDTRGRRALRGAATQLCRRRMGQGSPRASRSDVRGRLPFPHRSGSQRSSRPRPRR